MKNKLLFSHGANFVAKFGTPAKQTLDTYLMQLAAFDAKRGIATKIVFVDDPASVAEFGAPAAQLGTAQAIKATVDAIAAKSPQDYFVAVGGHDIVPMFDYPNPVSGTTDKRVPSDNGYASSSASSLPLVPDRMFARLPTGNEPTPILLWKQFDEILSFKPAKASASGYAFYADYWTQPSQSIAKQLGIPAASHSISPPVNVQPGGASFPAAGLSGGRIHYFNLHGDLRSAPWYGQDGSDLNIYPEACLPSMIPFGVRHSVAACEACYGGDSYGTKAVRRTAGTANCLAYMEKQAIGFCGSTTIAYGGTNDTPTPWAADLLVFYFLQGIRECKEMGAALRDAKVRMARDAIQKNGAYDDLTKKTLLQFLMYGDPSVAPIQAAVGAKSIRATGEPESYERLVAPLLEVQPTVTLIPARPVAKSGAKGVGSTVPGLPGKLAKSPHHLMHRERLRLTWARSDHWEALQNLGAKGIFSASGKAEEFSKEWIAETYEIGQARGNVTRYFVRVLEDSKKDYRIVAQAVSR